MANNRPHVAVIGGGIGGLFAAKRTVRAVDNVSFAVAKGETVKITGLMGVERVERAARTGRNPRTGEEIKIPAGFGVKLSAGSKLKAAVAKK